MIYDTLWFLVGALTGWVVVAVILKSIGFF